MRGGPETTTLEKLLRERGTHAAGDPAIERTIRQRYTDRCAVLILDASGFTRLTQDYGIIHFLSLVVAMRDLAYPCIDAQTPLATWAEADNLYAVFKAPEQGVIAALDVQEAVMAANAARPEPEQLPVCIGVGFGTVLRIGQEDVFGDQMNLASKLGEDIAAPDEVLVTEATWKAINGNIPGIVGEARSQRVGGLEIPYRAVHRAPSNTTAGSGDAPPIPPRSSP